MKEPSLRQKRVAAEIQACLSRILREDFSHHPVLGTQPITIMDVVVSPDLRHVKVHVVPLGVADPTPVLEALKKQIPAVRRLMAHQLDLRCVPQIVFKPVSQVMFLQPVEQEV